MNKWIWLGFGVVSELTASLSLKGALEQPLLYILVLLGYGSAFLFLIFAMRRGLGIGVAYGIWGALGVALTAVLGATLFGEPLTPLMIVGLLLIILGVLAIQLGLQRALKAQKLEGSGA